MHKIDLRFTESRTINGKDVFEETQQGKFYRVIAGSYAGDIVMRTGSSQHPFVCLRTGDLWGNSLQSYIFEELNLQSLTINL